MATKKITAAIADATPPRAESVPDLQVRYEDLDQLAGRMREDNPKAHDVQAIRESVGAVGYIDPLVDNDAPGGGLLAGHGRIKTLQAMRDAGEDAPVGVRVTADGRWAVPVLHGVALTAQQADRYVLAANQTTILGGWNLSLMAYLDRLDTEAGGLMGTGFGEEDLAALRAALAAPPVGLSDPDAIPEEPTDVYVQPGDLWVLGTHRLLCGNATSAADVARLLDGAKPLLTVSDAPYGVSYDPSWRNGARRTGKVTNDDRADWGEAWALSPSEVLYAWHGGLHAALTERSIAAAGFEVRAQIVWAKPALVMGRGHYHWAHEPCWYAVRRGATGHWIGDRTQSTVWQIDNVHSTRGTTDDAVTDHGTQKPVECMERPMRNHAGDVYDPFVGSGTTIIAAERQRRRAFCMDVEPRYVQIALERWQNYSGQRAVKELQS